MPFSTIPLNDGNKIPQLAFGTGTALRGHDATVQVEQALDSGFDHIDTAQIYRNEENVGEAIRESGLARSDLYITTKFFKGDSVRDEFNISLKKLGVSYVDLYLIHHPGQVDDIPATWKELEKIKADGLAKSIGVSNFTVEQLESLLEYAKVKPAVNQVEFHPYNIAENTALIKFAALHQIVIESYSGLTPITKQPGGPVDAPIQAAARRLGATPAQVIFLWIQAKGAVIVTTTNKKERLQEYLAVGNLGPLTQSEIEAIDAAGSKGSKQRRLWVLAAKNVLLFTGAAALYFGSRWLLG